MWSLINRLVCGIKQPKLLGFAAFAIASVSLPLHAIDAGAVSVPAPMFTAQEQNIAVALAIGLLLLLFVVAYAYRQRAQRESRLLADVARNLPFQALMVGPGGKIRLMTDVGLKAQEARGGIHPIRRPYDEFLGELVDQGHVFINGKTAHETFSLLGRASFKDSAEIDYRTSSGTIMHRQTKMMSDGSVLLIGRDVTDERNAQHLRLQAVINTTQSSIIGLSDSGSVTFVNNAARHMLGGISDEVPFDWPEPIRFVDAENFSPLDSSADPINRALSGISIDGETALMSRGRSDTEPRYVRLKSVRNADAGDTDVATILSIDDISELEKKRQQVERSSRLDALGQLTGGVAHDFNNILATIQYAMQLAEGKMSDERGKSYLATAQSSIARGSQLTQRLLAFAKRQPGRASSAFVGTVLDEFSRLARPVIEETVALSFIPPGEDLWVYCDVAQLENALLNLVLNSRDALLTGSNDSKITVTARGVAEIDKDVTLKNEASDSYIAGRGTIAEEDAKRTNDPETAYRYVEFSVTDNGPGMPDEIRRRAVDPFFTTKSSHSGTGLGLSMVYGFVQQTGGELRIYSEEGVGTTIRMLIPRGTFSGNREEPVERLPELTGAQQNILIVEDEPALLETMSEIVASLGYTVLRASNGQEALMMVREGQEIDLLLTDVVMPGGIGGFELAREVQIMMPHVPVLYMSGYAGFTEEQIGDVQAPLLQKPCPPAELAEAIHTALLP